MIHVRSLSELKADRPSLLTVGSFDGVHLGHQTLIRRLALAAHERAYHAAAVTFYPHPGLVLRGYKPSFYLSTPDDKANLLASLGADIVVTHPFNRDVANLTAAQFVDSLRAALDFRELWCGADFALGHNREGTVEWLKQYGTGAGFTMKVIEPVSLNGKVISSSRIRQALNEGEVGEAAACLGRPYQLTGPVVEGAKRGRTIGIPTANIRMDDDQAYPANGVYACRAWVNGEAANAVANIGLRPTFESGSKPILEAHLLDFDRDLYGQPLTLDFIARLRPEQKFNGVQELMAQIQKDIAEARTILSNK
jgi:riboflavin kinase/FMN adenylyltransferase